MSTSFVDVVVKSKAQDTPLKTASWLNPGCSRAARVVHSLTTNVTQHCQPVSNKTQNKSSHNHIWFCDQW
eukprot:5980106-Amphidinium_carterae.1